ncbi:MAG: DUF2142 domain-containing protein [Anaerolineae bacterium]|nr:DUF2142 domain-containing protein [Anaerolineae bacterium]NIN96585.1 DUF2142 domain-containing protein [Anaerolineae bacterium]NIQ81716.1 DUF2142 domain-containing protein [Anaerolineae bacterium]
MPHSIQDRAPRRFQGFLAHHLSLMIPLFCLSLLMGLCYSLVIPPWQAPDEPGHVEYAVRLAEKGWFLSSQDTSLELQRDILLSMKEFDFWRYVGRDEPQALPRSFADDQFLVLSGTQLGDESPLYYVVPALTFTLINTRDVLLQLFVVRWFSVVLTSVTVVISYLVAVELFPENRFMIIAIPAFVIFLPMLAYIGASANNDTLAVLLSSLLIWQLIRAFRKGVSKRSAFVLCTMALLSILAKKTALFTIPLLIIAIPAYLWSRHIAVPKTYRSVGAASCVLAALFLGVVLTCRGADAAGWAVQPESCMDTRSDYVARSGGHSLHVGDGPRGLCRRLMQSVSYNSVREVRGKEVTLNAWARTSTGKQEGSLAIVDGETRSTRPFVATETWSLQSLTHTVSSEAESLRVVLRLSPCAREDTGDLYFDDVALLDIEREGFNLVANGSAEMGSLRIGPRLERLARRVPLRQLLDARSYDLSSLRRYVLYTLLTFAGFWANFGWLTIPLDPEWYALLALCSLAAAIGLGVLGTSVVRQWKRDRSAVRTRHNQSLFLLVVAFCLILLQTFLPMIGRDWQPQGRYLFPAIIPIAALFSLGWSELVPRRSHNLLAIAWTVAFFLLNVLCLFGRISPHFYG